MSEQFSEAQDKILVKEAVSVRPFSQGKGLGWKMIASKLAKSTHLFPTPIKAKAMRERILYLMDDYCQRSTEEDCYSLDEEQLSMDQNLQQLVSLRDEAVKMAIQNRSVNSIGMGTEEERKTSDGEADQESGHRAQTAKVVEEKEGTKDSGSVKKETPQSPTTTSESKFNKGPGPAKGKRKLQPAPKPRQSKTAKDSNLIYQFLEEREAKRLKLREEELALRREELEERKKLLQMVEQRLEEEKKIRENMFTLISKVVSKPS